MAKKSKQGAVVALPTQNHTITSSIDMKLSKQDLIDLVVEETRERLAQELETASENLKQARKTKETVENTLKDAVVQEAKSLFKEEIAFVNKHFKNVTILPTTVRKGLIVSKSGLIDSESFYKNGVRRKRVYDVETKMLYNIDVKHTAALGAVEVATKDGDLYMKLQLDKKTSDRLHKDLVVALAAEDEAEDALYLKAQEMKNLADMGKRAKIDLIKRLLESSDDGKSILQNLEEIKLNVSQTLLLK